MRCRYLTGELKRDRLTQRGMALIIVLWAVALLTVVAASFAFETRTEALIASNVVEGARADAAAEAGLQRAIAGLLQPADLQWKVDGQIRTMEFAQATLRIAVNSEHGKIDLNAAPDVLIVAAVSRLLGGQASAGGATASEIADAMLDWRDQDHSRRPNGAEDEDYFSNGRRYGAADQSFVSVSELLQVFGMSKDAFSDMAGTFTVHTRSPRVDPGSASRDVLLSIPGLAEATVEEFLDARDLIQSAGNGVAVPRLPVELLVAGAGYLSRTRPNVYEILVEAREPGGSVGRRGAVVKLNRNRRQPYQILAWLLESDARFRMFESTADSSQQR